MATWRQLEAEVVKVAFGRGMGAEFVDDWTEVGQRADRGQSRRICWADQAAQRAEEQRRLHYLQRHAIIMEAAGEPLIRNAGAQRSIRELDVKSYEPCGISENRACP